MFASLPKIRRVCENNSANCMCVYPIYVYIGVYVVLCTIKVHSRVTCGFIQYAKHANGHVVHV